MILLDTHVWLWWVSEPRRLGKAASRAISSSKKIGVSAISCLEIATAVAKGRIAMDRDPLDWIHQSMALHNLELLPLSPAVAVKATQLGHAFHGDPADRIIVATAILESAVLVTKDERIRAYPAIETKW